MVVVVLFLLSLLLNVGGIEENGTKFSPLPISLVGDAVPSVSLSSSSPFLSSFSLPFFNDGEDAFWIDSTAVTLLFPPTNESASASFVLVVPGKKT